MEYEILEYLKTCANIIQNPTVPYLQFVEFLYKQAEASKHNLLLHVAHNHKEKLIPFLEILVNKRECILLKDPGGIKAVFIFQVAVQFILKKYEPLEYGYSESFPSLESIEFKLPQDSISVVDIKEDFVKLVSGTDTIQNSIIKILFPHNIDNILITKNIIQTKLIKYSVNIIKNFFQGQMNIEFVYNKIVSIFKGSEIALSDMLKILTAKPLSALQTLLEPNYFSFKFWSHIANLVLENLKEKAGKLTKDHGYCQAAYIIGYYIVYQKGMIQKEKEKKIDLRKIDAKLKKDPYAYTLKDIYGFVDKSGIPFIKKYSKKLIDDYLAQLTGLVDDVNTLPKVVRLKIKNNPEYYVLKESLIPLFINHVEEAAVKIKADLLEEWKHYSKNFIKDKAMTFDFAFLIELEKRIKEGFPMLYSLVTTNLLLLARNDPEVPETVQRALNRFLGDKNKLYEIDMLLDLDRLALLQEVKSQLPAYYTFPVINLFVHLFKWILGRKGKKAAGNEEKSLHRDHTMDDVHNNRQKNEYNRPKMSALDYNKAILELKAEICGKDRSMETSLKVLAEKWNPLIDPVSKSDLLEDVNSLIRDFIRRLQKSFGVKPPDAARIRNLAAELSNNKALERIKRKDYLIRYIEIYIIKCLGRM
ncbi:MAG: hypothetical protein JXB88_02370 [Spirochaetales bacterium]|nr:hypothetical protein [Spirochaetales bacterium]